MTTYRREAQNAEEIAKHLRSRGRTVITAPPRSGKTTELIRYAEERFPNGRFAFVVKEEDHPRIIRLHWLIYNGFSQADVVAARLLGDKLKGEDVNPPQLIYPEMVWARTLNPNTPTFVDDWNTLTEEVKKEIIKRRLFISAVTS